MKLRKILSTGAAAATAVVVATVIATPANAAEDTCIVVTTHCETNIIHANSSDWVYYKVQAGSILGANYRVVDVDTGVVVRSGFTRKTAPFYGAGSIYGLYGYYRLEVYNATPSARGKLYN
ncbi:hypothetical protein [Microbispora sp. NPDC049633]|uniref:hypothetical protein n=1 Tax=Microbispora sp. NPDC049633 TaxID=3154355 RepID=UPI003442C407